MWLAPALLIALLIRAMRPMLVVRIARLTSHRIGHFILDTDMYLSQRDSEQNRRRSLDVFYYGSFVCNSQLRKMWNRTIRISKLALHVDRVSRKLPGAQAHIGRIAVWSSFDQDMPAYWSRNDSNLSFTNSEKEAGERALIDLAIPEGDEFVCFHARDSSYLDEIMPEVPWRYHDYRDTDIGNMIPAMKMLGERNLHSIRMGAIVKDALITDDSKIVDYATNHHTDFLDIYLSANCKFFFGSHTGLFTVATTFRRPTALIDVVPLEMAPTWGPHDLFIPKKLWLKNEGRLMTFREIFESGAAGFHNGTLYEREGIQLIENTAEEIASLAVEMDDRLNGDWQSLKEDQMLQDRFWDIFQTPFSHGQVVSRIGAEFLRENRRLLD